MTRWISICSHVRTRGAGYLRGKHRVKCVVCGRRWVEHRTRRTRLELLGLLAPLFRDGVGVRAAARATGINKDTVCEVYRAIRTVYWPSLTRDTGIMPPASSPVKAVTGTPGITPLSSARTMGRQDLSGS